MPPDPVGDVGPNHYVQMVNTLVGIYGKTGTLLVPFFAIHDLFDTIGPPCALTDDGDPIVVYDPLADRWLLSQLCGETTSGARAPADRRLDDGRPDRDVFRLRLRPAERQVQRLSAFRRLAGRLLHDQQPVPDDGDVFAGGGAYAFDRAKMLAGDPTAAYVYFDEGDDRSRMSADSSRRTWTASRSRPPARRISSSTSGRTNSAIRRTRCGSSSFTWISRTPQLDVHRATRTCPLAAFDPRDSGDARTRSRSRRRRRPRSFSTRSPAR